MEHKRADLLGADPYPGETPQAESDREQTQESWKPDYTVAPARPVDSYNWSMSGTHIAVSNDDHGTQFAAMQWGDFSRPYAYGKVEVQYGWTTHWHVYYTNMSFHILEKRLKKFTRDQGWDWGGILDNEGTPVDYRSLKSASVPGIGEINPGLIDYENNDWSGMQEYDNPGDHQSDTPFYGFSDYDEDFPMTGPRTCTECGAPLLDYNDWRKHVLRYHVNEDRKPPGDPQPVVDLDDVLPAGFNEAVMDKTVQRQSRLIFQLAAEKPRNFIREAMGQRGELPVDLEIHHSINQDGDPIYTAYADGKEIGWLVLRPLYVNGDPSDDWYSPEDDRYQVGNVTVEPEYRRLGIATALLNKARGTYDVGHDWDQMTPSGEEWANKVGAQQPLIPGPLPFIFDIESDRIFVGHPGERHSDIKGRFTPGGIIEGVYDPKGNVQIRTDTDMPYTVRHMVELWYSMHPELKVKAVWLLQGDKKYRLASSNIGHKVRNLVATDPAAWAAFKALEPLGNVYAVGGAVRDVVLGKVPKDIDLMVQGVDPEDVESALKSLPGRVDFTGKQFGVFRYRDPEANEVEVALPRTERSTGPGYKDFEVVTNPYISVGEDLARRDFTGNAMAVNLATGDLVDPYHGSEDLKSGILRTVSDRSFLEDPLRILRAFGSVSRHGLDPDEQTRLDLAAHAHTLGELPRERLQAELDKLMGGSDPAKAIDLMEQTGVLQHVLPEVAATTGFDQKSKYHQHLLSDHMKNVLRLVAQQTNDVDMRWAAILHDIGKPGSFWEDEDGFGHYYKRVDDDPMHPDADEYGKVTRGEDHEELGAQMAEKLLTELRFPTDRIQRIVHLIRWHMFPPFSSMQGARKFINKVGDGHADDLLTLRWADSGGKDSGNPKDGSVNEMRQYTNAVRAAREPTDTSMLAINGKTLIEHGFKPGPEMGAILRHLTDLVIEDPSLNTPETLLQLAQNGAPAETARTANLRRRSESSCDIEALARASDKALDKAYGYGTAKPGEYGWECNVTSAKRVLKLMEQGETDIEKLADESHAGWAEATRRWKDHGDKREKRMKLADTPYSELPEEEKEKDRVAARALLAYYKAHSAEKKTSNILDPIKDELDPDVFNNADQITPTVKPKIAEWVRNKIYKTMIKAGWPDPSKYLTLVLTGSLTTYQWSEESDFDISLWVDVKHFPEYVRADLIALMIENCDGSIVPGTTHPMQCFVVDSMRFKKDDLYKPGLRSGYDLDNGKWLVHPEKSRSIDVSKMWPEHIRFAQMCVDKLKMMMRYDYGATKVYFDFIHRQRFLEQRAGKGDYSLWNIVYKMIENEGLFPELSQITGEYLA